MLISYTHTQTNARNKLLLQPFVQ